MAEDPRAALAWAAALWFGAQPETMVAVTGTNGKTSVATFTRQIWIALGHAAINIGTTGVEGAWDAPSAHTTPDPITLHRLLADAAAAGVTHAAMEASSHGLDQRRLDGVRLKAAGFTNFTQDHLDYHEHVRGLFRRQGRAVHPPSARGRRGGGQPERPARAGHGRTSPSARGQRLICASAMGPRRDLRILAPALRRHRAGGALSVAGPAAPGPPEPDRRLSGRECGAGRGPGHRRRGRRPRRCFAALPRLTGVRGRMQLAATRRNGASVFVDYAHTPDAIETALQGAAPACDGPHHRRLRRRRRPRPHQAPADGRRPPRDHADVLYVTDDNPRTEDPAAIRAAILAACPEANEVGDRAEAILRGVDALRPGRRAADRGQGA